MLQAEVKWKMVIGSEAVCFASSEHTRKRTLAEREIQATLQQAQLIQLSGFMSFF